MFERRDMQIAGALVGGTTLCWFVFRSLLSLQGLALGSDPVLWTLTMENLRVGAEPMTPPLYPMLASILRAVTGQPAYRAGLSITAICSAVLPAAVYLVARHLGALRSWAGVAAGIALVSPGIVHLAYQVQPDSLIALLLVLTVPVAGRWLEAPSPRSLALLALWAAMVPLAREHGYVLAVTLAGAAAWPVARPLTRALRVGAVLLAVLLGPALTLQPPNLPHLTPWMDRIRMAVVGQEPAPKGSLVGRWQHRHEKAHATNDRIGIAMLHAERSLTVATAPWAFVLLAAGTVFLRPPGRRLASLLPLTTITPALVVYTEPRHVMVALPVALAASAGTLSVARRSQLALVAAGSSFTTIGLFDWPSTLSTFEAGAARVEAALAETVCPNIAKGDLVSGNAWEIWAYCPHPYTSVLPDMQSDADWRTWFVGDGTSPGLGWRVVAQPDPKTYIWRLHPQVVGPDRPCSGSVPVSDAPYLSLHPTAVQMVPPCGQGASAPRR